MGGSECHTHTRVTHQEFPQVFVVGDDAVVDDDELCRQRKGPAQPRHQPPGLAAGARGRATQTAETTKLYCVKSRTWQKEKESFTSWCDFPALPHLAWLVMAEDDNAPGGIRATAILWSSRRHSSAWQFPACWKQLNTALLLPACRCCSSGGYTER